MANITPDQIGQAVAQLGHQEPCWLERYEAGAKVLALGGWRRHKQFTTFPGGVVTQPGGCSCQEGWGPIVCLHRVALAVLDYAETHCADCGALLTESTVARIGHHLQAICRSCRADRVAAGRQRQLAADWALVTRQPGPTRTRQPVDLPA